MSIASSVARWGRMLPLLVIAACGTAPTGSSRAADAPASLTTTATADPAHIRQVIEQNNARLIETFVAGDAGAAAALFDDDAVLMLPGIPQIAGRGAIEQALAGAFAAVKYHRIVANVQEVQYFGDYALEMGTSEFTYEVGGRTFVDQGKYVVGWKRQPSGEWKIHRDVSNVTSSSAR
jgi:uncharacterized protein (TIGR02246 family)